jgi:hypothetical protein
MYYAGSLRCNSWIVKLGGCDIRLTVLGAMGWIFGVSESQFCVQTSYEWEGNLSKSCHQAICRSFVGPVCRTLWYISAKNLVWIFISLASKKYLKNTLCWLLANDVLLCESIVRICLVVSTINWIRWSWLFGNTPLINSRWFATGAVLSSAIVIDPVNIKQINATKIHDVSNVSDGNLLIGMRYVPAYWL